MLLLRLLCVVANGLLAVFGCMSGHCSSKPDSMLNHGLNKGGLATQLSPSHLSLESSTIQLTYNE